MGSEDRVELSEDRQLLGLRDGDGSVVRCKSPNLKKAMGTNHCQPPIQITDHCQPPRQITASLPYRPLPASHTDYCHAPIHTSHPGLACGSLSESLGLARLQ